MFNIKTRIDQTKDHFSDVLSLGLFLDNHDNPRFLSQYNDQNAFVNALIFSLSHTGIPFIYQGTEQR